jgi:hypothetical protein
MDDERSTLTPRKQRILDAVMDNAPAVIRRFYRPDCCIAATRVLVEVFTRLRCLARPLSVVTEVRNGVMVELGKRFGHPHPLTEAEGYLWRDLGAWSVIMGLPGVPYAPDRWPGHLACLVWESVLCDIAVTQATRPHIGIHLLPVAVEVRPEFLCGGESSIIDVGDCELYYETRPADRSYADAVDWYDKARHERAIESILFRAKRALA